MGIELRSIKNTPLLIDRKIGADLQSKYRLSYMEQEDDKSTKFKMW